MCIHEIYICIIYNILCVHVALIFSQPTEAVRDLTCIKTDDSTSDSGTTIKIAHYICILYKMSTHIVNS